MNRQLRPLQPNSTITPPKDCKHSLSTPDRDLSVSASAALTVTNGVMIRFHLTVCKHVKWHIWLNHNHVYDCCHVLCTDRRWQWLSVAFFRTLNCILTFVLMLWMDLYRSLHSWSHRMTNQTKKKHLVFLHYELLFSFIKRTMNKIGQ